jgi:myo-inositol 2-dehydrogenase / D-chiro-inositol 1-dehydrogenase
MSLKLEMRPPKLKLALAGLGRIGKKHAANFLNQSKMIDFVAVFAPTTAEFQWGAKHLAPYGVFLYSRYDEMMSHPGLDAVLIATAAAIHEVQIMQALEQNLHVLCEKPLSTNIEGVSPIMSFTAIIMQNV